jgi:hypothetical protein
VLGVRAPGADPRHRDPGCDDSHHTGGSDKVSEGIAPISRHQRDEHLQWSESGRPDQDPADDAECDADCSAQGGHPEEFEPRLHDREMPNGYDRQHGYECGGADPVVEQALALQQSGH